MPYLYGLRVFQYFQGEIISDASGSIEVVNLYITFCASGLNPATEVNLEDVGAGYNYDVRANQRSIEEIALHRSK
jgi:hypothetical protein